MVMIVRASLAALQQAHIFFLCAISFYLYLFWSYSIDALQIVAFSWSSFVTEVSGFCLQTAHLMHFSTTFFPQGYLKKYFL